MHTDSFIVEGTTSQEYTIKAWISEDNDLPTTDTSNGDTHSNQTTSEKFKFKIKVVATDSALTVKDTSNLDTSGANAPELAAGMVPIYYDGTTWRIADPANANETHRWYSYADSGETKGMWANAALVKESGTQTRAYYSNQANVGEAVSMEDILQMYVWIPRFSAITPTTPANLNNPPAINITFVDNNTTAHDAFTFDGAKSGIWVGKFETGHTTLASNTTANNLGCSDDHCSSADGLIIKPSATILRYNNVSNFFYASRSVEKSSNPFGLVSAEVDTHMMKNNEWGAVAYLTQSIYGRCSNATTCSEIGINNNSSFITGYGAPAGTAADTNNGIYGTPLGQNASTTGNIYGIYDMSGGAYEYVMGNYDNTIGNSGFGSLPATKYVNTYTTETVYNTSGLQHALTETGGWYGDSVRFVRSYSPWFIRGDHYCNTGYAGVFYFYNDNGNSLSGNGFRLALVK